MIKKFPSIISKSMQNLRITINKYKSFMDETMECHQTQIKITLVITTTIK